MKTYALTGIGPTNQVDGSIALFTVRPAPFIATAEWLAAQSKHPEMGDKLEVHENGDHVLVTEAQAVGDEAAGLTVDPTITDDTQKKSLGADDLGNGSENSPARQNLENGFKLYQAKPLQCSAAEITEVMPSTAGANSYSIGFADGSFKTATAEMTSRMIPQVGDYWVISRLGTANVQPHGEYDYLNPKAVFESKYEPVAE